MFVPIVLLAAGIYQSHKLVGWLATTFVGALALEGRMAVFENERHARNYWRDINPFKDGRFYQILKYKESHEIPFYPRYRTIVLDEKVLPEEEFRCWDGKYLLSTEEEAQMMDTFKSIMLRYELGVGKEFADLCRKSGLDFEKIRGMVMPESSPNTVNLTWYKEISAARLADPDFISPAD